MNNGFAKYTQDKMSSTSSGQDFQSPLGSPMPPSPDLSLSGVSLELGVLPELPAKGPLNSSVAGDLAAIANATGTQNVLSGGAALKIQNANGIISSSATAGLANIGGVGGVGGADGIGAGG